MDANPPGRERLPTPFPERQDPPRGTARPTTDPHQVEFGRHLRERCAGLARDLARPGGPALACAAAEAVLPAAAAARLGLVADELVADAFRHAFPNGRTGEVRVLFAADPDAWRLTVEDSGVGLPRGHGRRRGADLEMVGRLLGELGGRLELPGVAGGTRRVAVVPRRGPSLRPCCTINAAGDVGPTDPG